MKESLSKPPVIDFLQKSTQGLLPLEEQEKFLKSYQLRSPEELKEIVHFFEANRSNSPGLKGAIDVCGTGGSGLPKINTSTIVALILASLGIRIAKHGNRAVTSKCGSFDLLDAMGLDFSKSNQNSEVIFQKENCAFLFAPNYHPLMKHFQVVRKNIKQPTFFNILGPLLNPADVEKQVIGTPFKGQMKLLAETCRLLGKKHVFLVSSEDGLDEVSVSGPTKVVELKNGKIREYTLHPEDFGLNKLDLKKVLGANITRNRKIAEEIIKGKKASPHMDLVLANVALALQLVRPTGLKKACEYAKLHLNTGKVEEKCQSLRRALNTPSVLLEIAGNKEKELELRKKLKPITELKKEVQPSTRSEFFLKEIKQKKGLKVIAEVKKASPSAGKIFSGDPIDVAQKYEQEGVLGISVVCDKKFFGGDLNILNAISKATSHTPLLCKDFIIDEYQIYEARAAGADLILLIAALLKKEQIQSFLEITKSLKMLALCEVHNKEELRKVLQTSAQIIGINNRNLDTFQIDLKTTENLVPFIPKTKLIISESGFHTSEDLKTLPKRVHGILVGTALMRSENIQRKLMELKGQRCKVKICGVKTVKEALFCERNGADFIGLNFVPTSKRKISIKKARKICESVNSVKKVGVFMNQTLKEVQEISLNLDLDYIQLSGEETLDYIRSCPKPVFKTIKLRSGKDLTKATHISPHVYAVIFDHSEPGNGKSFDHSLLKNFKGDFILAGGVNPSNITDLVKTHHPVGIDVASGVETKGKRDFSKIKQLLSSL